MYPGDNRLNLFRCQTFKCVVCSKLIFSKRTHLSFLQLCKLCKRDKKKVYFLNYKKHSLKRWKESKEFGLTFNQFWNIKENSCNYCGKPGGIDNPNGIDRINSKIGYVIDNCVSCCFSCNIMKHSFSIDYFLKHIEKIYRFNLKP